MIPNIDEKEKEIKEIWLEHKDNETTKQIFTEHLSKYFTIEPFERQGKDFLRLMAWVNKWKKEVKKEEVEELMGNMTDKEALDIQEKNRRRLILMLEKVLDGYAENPDKFLNIPIAEIRRLYQTIQGIEESIKKTEIARSKLKVEAIKTFLPYMRMSPEELSGLKNKLNESFDRIIKLKRGESTGGDTTGGRGE